jgi:8-oxo-dGTP pyrophosphatase MutT (NUDIX family)
MAARDGDGWTRCDQGHRHWGRFGAAGLLVYASDPAPDNAAGRTRVLLVRRPRWHHHGGSWGSPGGARDSHESDVAAAFREIAEECGILPDAVRVRGVLRGDHGGWSYQTVIAEADEPLPVRPARPEIAAAEWIAVDEVDELPLHPGFREQWPALRDALVPRSIIVDVANVMGARADGWWRDRAGAARRLRDELTSLSARGVSALPDDMAEAAIERWFPDMVLVLEGAARAAARADAAAAPGGPVPDSPVPDSRVRVVTAPGSGDDTIAKLAGELPGRRVVVTADRELRRRCVAVGASVTGPRWLLGQL